MQTAIYLNNRASTLIEKDSFEKAIDMLNQALAAVQKDELNESSSAENSRKFSTRNCTTGRPSGKYLSTSNKRRKELDDRAAFLYSRPVYVSHVPQAEGHAFLSWVIIFNFALCHHLMALRAVDSKNKHENLVASLKLYEVAASMETDATFQIESTYFMAMINNAAQICEMLHRPRQAKQHLSQMLALIMITIESGEADTVEEFDGYLLNVTRKTFAVAAY